ncbi:MAG: hypothetical protein WC223_05120 [Bacteroidales bacterium]|jgi:hypothetical protein
MEPKITSGGDNSTNIFLTGAILLANMDYSGLAEYALKAAIGGAIWVVFKLTSDYVSHKFKINKND